MNDLLEFDIPYAVSAAHGFIDAPGEPSEPELDDVMEQAAEAMRRGTNAGDEEA